MEQSKACYRCKQIKPHSAFGIYRSKKDGLNIYCKECEKLRNHQNRLNPNRLAQAQKATLNHRNNNLYRYRSNYHAWQCRKWGNPVFKISDKELIRLYKSPCLYCGSTENIQMDHCIPKTLGGSHGVGNLIPLCAEHNLAKNVRSYMEMRIKLESKRI